MMELWTNLNSNAFIKSTDNATEFIIPPFYLGESRLIEIHTLQPTFNPADPFTEIQADRIDLGILGTDGLHPIYVLNCPLVAGQIYRSALLVIPDNSGLIPATATSEDIFFSIKITVAGNPTIFEKPVTIIRPTASFVPVGTQVIGAGYTPVVTINAAGTAAIAPNTPFMLWSQPITAQAGVALYTYNFTLDNTQAVAGAQFSILISLPASTNPTIRFYDESIGSTLIQTVTNPDATARYFLFVALFDGANWMALSGEYIN